MVESIEELFPGLRTSIFQVTSPKTRDYNCIAWAVGDTTHWWWPDPDNDAAYWPAGVVMEETLEAFVAAFATLGYSPASSQDPEPGFEKIALYGIAGNPTHASRQLQNGRWTSKLGAGEDIEHDLHALDGDIYGTMALVMKRVIFS